MAGGAGHEEIARRRSIQLVALPRSKVLRQPAAPLLLEEREVHAVTGVVQPTVVARLRQKASRIPFYIQLLRCRDR
jgi:hypothetical protein